MDAPGERFYMDVKKLVCLLACSTFLIHCGQRSNGGDPAFKKSGQEICQDSVLQGEYLVHWKNGEVTVEHSDSDEAFID